MSHKHYCHAMSHWFECNGKVLRLGGHGTIYVHL